MLFFLAALGIVLAFNWGVAHALHRASSMQWSFNSDNERTPLLLVIAHPDDECMFFGPTITRATRTHAVHVLCLSNGNADGMGKVREKELMDSCEALGISRQNVTIVDDPLLPDGMGTEWPTDVVAKQIADVVVAKNIEILITFDEEGISQHPNHRACYEGVRTAITMPELRSTRSIVRAYALETVPLFRKYMGILDLVLTSVLHERTTLVSVGEWIRIMRALACHKSQQQAFRLLYPLFSRYIYINSLVAIDR